MRSPRRNAGSFAHITLAQELDGLAAYMAGLDEDERDDFDFYDEIRPILNRHLGRPLGPSADWVNPTWRLGDDLYLFEGDYDDFEIVLRVPHEDPDEDDVIEDVEHLPDFDALRRYFRERARRNPSRKTPPPQHTFALEASAVQQGLFAPSSYEAKPKKRTVEPTFVDERQVDMFAPPPPPAKKNPYPRRRR